MENIQKQHMYMLHGMQKDTALPLPYPAYLKADWHLWQRKQGISDYLLQLQHFFFLQGQAQLNISSILETSSHERLIHIALRFKELLHCVCIIIIFFNPIYSSPFCINLVYYYMKLTVFCVIQTEIF